MRIELDMGMRESCGGSTGVKLDTELPGPIESLFGIANGRTNSYPGLYGVWRFFWRLFFAFAKQECVEVTFEMVGVESVGLNIRRQQRVKEFTLQQNRALDRITDLLVGALNEQQIAYRQVHQDHLEELRDGEDFVCTEWARSPGVAQGVALSLMSGASF